MFGGLVSDPNQLMFALLLYSNILNMVFFNHLFTDGRVSTREVNT
jgi:hypothetical protein